MDRYEVMTGKMMPLTDGAHRKWGFTGKDNQNIGYEWTGRAHGSLADALATLAVQRWLEQWLVAE